MKMDLKPDSPVAKHYLILTAILFLAFVVRLMYFLEMQQSPVPAYMAQDEAFDQYRFVSLARNILEHKWLGNSFEGYSPTYSYFLAAIFYVFGESFNAVFLFQIVFGVFAVFIVYQSAGILFENKTVGLAAAVLTALYAPFIFYECAILRDSGVMFITLLGFYFLLLSYRYKTRICFFFSGIILGLSSSLRPNVLQIVLLPCMLFWGKEILIKRIAYVVFFVFGLSLAILPTFLRNQAIGHDVLVEAPGPTIFWLGNARDSNGIGIGETSQLQKDLAQETQGRILKTFFVLGREMMQHPADYIRLYYRKFKMLFNEYEIPSNLSFDLARSQSAVLNLSFVTFGVISPLGILGMLLLWPKRAQYHLLYLFLFVLCFFIFGFHVLSRYRLPVVPYFIIFASYSLYWLWEKMRLKEWRRLSFGLGILLFAVFLTRLDVMLIKKYFGGRIRFGDYSNLANAYIYVYKNGKNIHSQEEQQALLHRALDNRRKSIDLAPLDFKIEYLFDLGLIYIELAQYPQAIEIFKKVLTLQPSHALASTILNDLHDFRSQSGSN